MQAEATGGLWGRSKSSSAHSMMMLMMMTSAVFLDPGFIHYNCLLDMCSFYLSGITINMKFTLKTASLLTLRVDNSPLDLYSYKIYKYVLIPRIRSLH